jgi:hypothetical protein
MGPFHRPLEMDIEVFECELLESRLAAKILIGQIFVEFPDFFPDIPKAKTKNASLRSAISWIRFDSSAYARRHIPVARYGLTNP